jgi:predicted  nucleic acid-binding Zn-ribbon protein
LTEQHLKRIQDKLQQLLRNHIALQKENSNLRKELEKTKQQTSHHRKNTDDLKQRLDVLKINAGEMNATDKKEFEKRINSYLKEIDRCIALLSE